MNPVDAAARDESIVMPGTPDQLDMRQHVAHGLAGLAHVGVQVHRDAGGGFPVDCPVYVLVITGIH